LLPKTVKRKVRCWYSFWYRKLASKSNRSAFYSVQVSGTRRKTCARKHDTSSRKLRKFLAISFCMVQVSGASFLSVCHSY